MKQIPVDQNKIPGYNKKAIKLILVLFICGIVTGLVLSTYFTNEANERIENFPHNGGGPPHFNNTHNKTFDFFEREPLTNADVFIPSIGVVIVCISTFLLIGLIVIYIKIFFTSNSKYVVGLLMFLSPLLIQSIFSLNALRSLFVSPRIPEPLISNTIGFGFGGLGGMLVVLSIFEIIGLSILLYLSSE